MIFKSSEVMVVEPLPRPVPPQDTLLTDKSQCGLHKTEAGKWRRAARGAAYPLRTYPGKRVTERERVLAAANPPPPRPVVRPRLERLT